jgi:predicted house-cleaning noncanonical NTP pyrophosphatase (MazG superfamily)
MKLVRDNYDPDRLKSRKVASDTEFKILLRAKLVEEASEVMVAMDHDNLLEEIGDVLDVLDGIVELYQIDRKELENKRKNKCKLKGGFTKGVVKLK